MQWIIRPAQKKDIPQLCVLWNAQQEFHHAIQPSIYRKLTPNVRIKIRRFLNTVLQNKKVKLFVATVDSDCVGFVAFRAQKEAYFDTNIKVSAMITELFVSESARRKGIASALIAQVEAWSRKHNVDCVELRVSVYNIDAKELYVGAKYSEMSISMIKRL